MTRSTRPRTTAMALVSALLGASLLTVPPASADEHDDRSILVYTHDWAVDGTLVGFGEAVGLPVDDEEELPEDLSSYACIVLPINRSFEQDAPEQLVEYTTSGGHLIALGDRHEGDEFVAATATLNHLAGELGSSLQLAENSLDQGPQTTENIDDVPLTTGVNTVGYGLTNTVDIGDGQDAQSLVRRELGDQESILAAEPIGDGLFVLGGDSNIFADNPDVQPYEYDNGILARNLCDGRPAAGPTYAIDTLHDATKANKANSTVPIKIQVAQGGTVAPDLVLTAIELTHGDQTISPVPSPGNSFPGGEFKRSGNGYQLNIKTGSGFTPGAWTLHFTISGDSTVYTTTFTIR